MLEYASTLAFYEPGINERAYSGLLYRLFMHALVSPYRLILPGHAWRSFSLSSYTAWSTMP